MNVRFPRLSQAQAIPLLEKRGVQTLESLEGLTFDHLANEKFAPTGPAKVEFSVVQDLHEDLTSIARKAGYPKRSDAGYRDFDHRAAILLQDFGMPLSQALRPDVWAWIAIRLVPHLVEWRWGAPAKQANSKRYAGIVQRNAIGRLWYRAHVMANVDNVSDRWSTLRAVNEDAHVQVLERTSIAKNRRLARMLVDRWVKLGGGEDLLRNAIIRVRMRALLVEFTLLSDTDLQCVVDDSFRQAKSHLERQKAA